MINIVLMAGHGRRFSEVGYKISKPLLPVLGKPMIIRATESMPQVDAWVFVVRSEHLEDQDLISNLKSVAKNVIILVDPNPIGQLNSALVAKDFIAQNDWVFIGACDFGMAYDHNKYQEVVSDPSSSPSVIVWSFTRQPNLSRNPSAWGWLKQENNLVSGVSVKIPVSGNPYNDYAITGSFTFRSGREFLELAAELIKRNLKVKNEFYIDSILGLACELGKKVISFPVDKYIGWGTPADYEEYLYWEKVFSDPQKYSEAEEKPEYQFWREYFSSVSGRGSSAVSYKP